jgi:hypothetical protein
MEIRITRAGAEVGRLRVAPGGASGSTIQVNEFSRGRLNLQDNDRLEVLRSWRVRDRLVAANAAFDVDSRVAYTNQHSVVAPVANSGGGAYAGWAAQATAVTHNAALSYTVDPDSSGALSYSWTFPAGASPATSSSAAPTVDYSGCGAGSFWTRLVVTDTSNGQTATKYLPVRLHDANDPPYDLLEASLSGNLDSGYNATFTLPVAADLDAVPDGSLVMFWAVERYGTQTVSYGDPYRPTQKFTGYLVRDSISRDPVTQTLTFEAIDAWSLLAQLPGFSNILTNVASPTSWQQYAGLTVRAAIITMLRERTTVLVTCDLIFADTVTTYPYPELAIEQQVPSEQIRSLADALDCVVIGDRRGRIRIVRPTYYLTTVQRAAAVNVVSLNEDDLLTFDASRNHRYTYNLLEGQSISTSGSALFSRAPGLAPSEGGGATTADRLIVFTQAEINERTGRRYAKLNNLYFGLPTASDITLTLRGGYDVFDVAYPDEWVTLDDVTSWRVDYDPTRCVLQNYDVSYRPEGNEISLRLSAETDGEAGATYVPPLPNDTGFPVFEPISILPILPPAQTINRIGAWDGINRLPIRIGALNANTSGFAVITLNSDFTSSATAYNTGLSGNGMDWAQDPWRFSRQFVLTSTGLYKVDDIDAFTTWSLVANNATMFGDAARIGVRIIMSSNKRGWIAIASGYSLAVTFNYGATWTQVDVSGTNSWNTLSPNFDQSNMNIEISPWNSSTEGHMYAAYALVANSAIIRKSTDYGLTWSALINRTGGPPSGVNYAHIKIPYKIGGVENRNGDGQKIYALIRNLNVFDVYTQATLTEEVAASGVVDSFPGGGLHAFTWDGNRIAIARGTTLEVKAIAVRTAPGAFTSTGNRFGGFGAGGDPKVGISGFSFHSDFLCAWWRGSGGYGVGSLSLGNPLVISPDFGTNWYNITPTTVWSSPYRVAVAGALLTDFQ